MKLKYYQLFSLILLLLVSCHSQKIDQDEAHKWLQEYREEKSKEWIATLSLLPPVEFRKKYWHEDFDTVVGDRKERRFIVLSDDFLIESITLDDDKEYQKKYNNQCYYIQGKEIYLGEVVNGEYVPYESKKIFPTDYLVIKKDTGYLSMMDWMYSDFYILEKDVPALLERLKGTGDEF